MRKFGVVWVYIDLPGGCNLAAHSSIHASFILRRGLTRFQLPKGFLGLRIIVCILLIYWNEARPGAIQQGTSHSLLPIICKPGLDNPGQVPIAGNHWLSLLVHLSSLHRHSLGSIHLNLLFCWVELTLQMSIKWDGLHHRWQQWTNMTEI